MALPPRLLSRLADLVALPSVSSALAEWNQSNRAVVERLAEELNAAGFTVRLQTVSRAPDKVNLIARRGEGEGGLVLAGHSDTVPCDPDAWHSDPFTLTEREGRLYGLGVADMKGFLALAVEAALEAAAHPLAAPLVLLVTADEESSMAGARALAAADLPPGAAVVIGEPTGNRPVDRHKGVMMERLRLRGRAGHASDPAAGRSALEGMHELIGELLALREAWAARWRDPRFRVPVPTLNLGRIHGGDNPNRICAECELDIDIRLLPGMAIEPLRAELAERLSAVAARRGLEGDMRPLFPGNPPFCAPAGSPIVALAERLSGAPAGDAAFATEAPYLAALGLDVVVLGPGDIGVAHQPDEHVPRERLGRALEILRGLIAARCRAP